MSSEGPQKTTISGLAFRFRHSLIWGFFQISFSEISDFYISGPLFCGRKWHFFTSFWPKTIAKSYPGFQNDIRLRWAFWDINLASFWWLFDLFTTFWRFLSIFWPFFKNPLFVKPVSWHFQKVQKPEKSLCAQFAPSQRILNPGRPKLNKKCTNLFLHTTYKDEDAKVEKTHHLSKIRLFDQKTTFLTFLRPFRKSPKVTHFRPFWSKWPFLEQAFTTTFFDPKIALFDLFTTSFKNTKIWWFLKTSKMTQDRLFSEK